MKGEEPYLMSSTIELSQHLQEGWKALRGRTYDLLDVLKQEDLEKKLPFPTSQSLYYQLTLRSKLNRLELTQDSVGRMQSSNIEFGFERKVIEFGGFPQPFQLDERA